MMDIVALDMATTAGAESDTRHDRVLAAAVFGNPDVDLAVLMDPGVSVPPEATMATGIDDAVASGGMDYRKGLEAVARSLNTAWRSGLTVAGYEVNTYLLPVLFHQETAMNGRRITRPGKMMNVKTMFRRKHPGADFSLPSIAAFLGVDLGNGTDVCSRAAAVLSIASALESVDSPRPVTPHFNGQGFLASRR